MINFIFLMALLMPFSFAQAEDIKVNAEYAQSLNNPGENEFRITDPCEKTLALSVFCNDDLARVITVDSGISRYLAKGERTYNHLFYHRFHGEKTVQLFNENGSPALMKYSLTHTGYTIQNNYFKMAKEDMEAGPGSKCKLVDYVLSKPGDYTGDYIDTLFYAIDLSAQKNGGECFNRDFSLFSSVPRYETVKRFFIGYKLTPVNIGAVSNGVYKGKLRLSVGGYGDIDFSPHQINYPLYVALEFTLVVRNQLKVVFPPSGNKVFLQPDGGRLHGEKISSLSGVVPVEITSSIPYWIKLECQYLSVVDDSCQIKNDRNTSLASMSIYKKSTKGNILLSPTIKRTFGKNEPISNGFLFKVNKDKVKDMINNPGTYKGNVTIIMDAMIEPVYK
jgi:hypothetical protein